MIPEFRSSFVLYTALAFFALLVRPGCSRADERYYMLVFGAQNRTNLIRYSHTFGTFVKTVGNEPPGSPYVVTKTATISWLPQDLEVRVTKPHSEPGINLDLYTTLDWYLNHCPDWVSLWGPYEICPELYRNALARAAYLESGVPLYHIANKYRRPLVLDCIHALAGVDGGRGYFRTRSACGDIASYYVLHHLSPGIIHPELTYDWLLEPLRLDRYPLERRGFDCKPRDLFPILPPRYINHDPYIPILPWYRLKEQGLQSP